MAEDAPRLTLAAHTLSTLGTAAIAIKRAALSVAVTTASSLVFPSLRGTAIGQPRGKAWATCITQTLV